MQIIKFIIVGGIATVIDYVIFFILHELLGINTIISNIISFTVSVIYNYIASVKWVFEVDESKDKKQQFIIFIVFYFSLLSNLPSYVANCHATGAPGISCHGNIAPHTSLSTLHASHTAEPATQPSSDAQPTCSSGSSHTASACHRLPPSLRSKLSRPRIAVRQTPQCVAPLCPDSPLQPPATSGPSLPERTHTSALPSRSLSPFPSPR